MKLKKKILISIIAVGVATSMVGITAVAQTGNRAANIKSKGIFDYQNGTTVMDSSDLIYLANEIDSLEHTYKSKTVEGLNTIGTYYTADGSVSHENSQSVITPELSRNLTFDQLLQGILESQSIPEGESFQDISGQQYYKTVDGRLTTASENADGDALLIHAATAENLSAGVAAWVNGTYIVGTGADNNSYYNQGCNTVKQEIQYILKAMYNSETNSEHYQGCNVYTYCDTYNGGGEDTKSDNFSVEIPLTKTTDDGSYYLLNSLSIVFSNSSLKNCKCDDSVFANSSVTVNVKTDKGKEIATNKANINMFEVSLDDADSVIVSGRRL